MVVSRFTGSVDTFIGIVDNIPDSGKVKGERGKSKRVKKMLEKFVDRNVIVVSLHAETVLLCWRGAKKTSRDNESFSQVRGHEQGGNDLGLPHQRTGEMG